MFYIYSGEEGITSRSLSFTRSQEFIESLTKIQEDGDMTAEALDELLIAKALHELEDQEKGENLNFKSIYRKTRRGMCTPLYLYCIV